MVAHRYPLRRTGGAEWDSFAIPAAPTRPHHPLDEMAMSSPTPIRSTPPVLVCLQCGTPAHHARASRCRRCGLAYGEPPRATGSLATCPICYRVTDEDGMLRSLANGARRLNLLDHVAEHEAYPVGDDEYLESLRRGDRIVIERWEAPFDVVRHYLVTGVISGGQTRSAAHGVIVMAMSQLARFGPDATMVGDEPEWRAARDAVSRLMERYHRQRV
jgi:hypothetical protein